MSAHGDRHAGLGAPLSPLTLDGALDGKPHGSSRAASHPLHAAMIAAGAIAKAEGPLGRTVKETYDQRRALAGKAVRVRGIAVKVITGVLGRSFVHLRDGTESPAIGDLLITTEAVPAIGAQVLFAGHLSTDRDFGAGYAYPIVLEDAELVSERPTSTL